jgi:L-ascorbate metabolism protein UlaG (beta-lactamase superfamily)
MEKRTWVKKGAELKNEIDTILVPEGQLALWHFGQCGFIIKSSNLVVAIDIVLSDLYDKEGKSRRLFAPPFEPKDCPHIDYICCSHSHADHLDVQTLQGVLDQYPDAKGIVPAANRQMVGMLDPRQVLFARQEEQFFLSSACHLKTVAVAHEEYTFDEQGNSLYLGFIFDFGPLSLFHGGDLIVEPLIQKKIEDRPCLDIMLLPINGRDAQRQARGIIGNMDSREAALFASKTRARLLIPTHFDMFAANGADLNDFAFVLKESFPSVRYQIPQLGKMIGYTKRDNEVR